MSRLRGFAVFWWRFVAGDDWRVAAGIVVALALTGLLAHHGHNAWWLMPLAVALLLATALRRAARAARAGSEGAEPDRRAEAGGAVEAAQGGAEVGPAAHPVGSRGDVEQ